MKKLSRIFVCFILVIALVLSTAACKPTKPRPEKTPTPTPVVTATPTPEKTPTPVTPTPTPTKTPGGSGGEITFPDGWDKPTVDNKDVTAEQASALTDNGTYYLNAKSGDSVTNESFTGTLIVDNKTAIDALTLNLPNASIEFKGEYNNLTVTSGQHTARFAPSARITGTLTVNGGNVLAEALAEIKALVVAGGNTTTSNVHLLGAVLETFSTATPINLTFQAPATAQAQAPTFTNSAVGTVLEVVGSLKALAVTNASGSTLVVDVTQATQAKPEEKLAVANSGTLQVVAGDKNVADLIGGTGSTAEKLDVIAGLAVEKENFNSAANHLATGFNISATNALNPADIKSVVVELFAGSKLVSTNTMTAYGIQKHITDASVKTKIQFSSPFYPIETKDQYWNFGTNLIKRTDKVDKFVVTVTPRVGAAETATHTTISTTPEAYQAIFDATSIASDFVQKNTGAFVDEWTLGDNNNLTYNRVGASFNFKSDILAKRPLIKSLTATLNFANGQKLVHTAKLSAWEGVTLSGTDAYFYGSDGLLGEIKTDRTWWTAAPIITKEMGNPKNVTLTVTDKLGNVSSATSDDLTAGELAKFPSIFTDVKVKGTKEIASGKTLTIPEGVTLTIPVGATLTNNGTIVNKGTIVVNDEAGFLLALTAGGNVKLGANITLTQKTNQSFLKSTTLDLNGKTLTSPVILLVGTGVELTIKDTATNGAIENTRPNNDGIVFEITAGGKVTQESGTIEAKNASGDHPENYGYYIHGQGATLIVNGGTIKAVYCISGNGSSGKGHEGTVVTINGGELTGTYAGNSSATAGNSSATVGIYQPHYGTVNVNGGTITADTAISIKDGILNVTKGTVKGIGTFADPAAVDNNGAEFTGAAISITNNPGYVVGNDSKIKVTISGGTFTSTNGYALYEGTAVKNGTPITTNQLIETLNVTRGTFTGNAKKGDINTQHFAFLSNGNHTYESVDPINEGMKLTIPVDQTFIVGSKFFNNGTIVVNNGKSLIEALYSNGAKGIVEFGSNIKFAESYAPLYMITGTLDGKGHTLSGLEHSSGGIALAEWTNGDTVIKNLHIDPRGKATQGILPLIGNGFGKSITFEKVIIDKATIEAMHNDSNESAYMCHTLAATTTFKDCTSNVNYISPSAQIYMSAFLGGYADGNNGAKTLNFDTCINNGNISATQAGVFVGNGSNMQTVDVTATNCQNNGEIVGTTSANYFAPVAHDFLKVDYDETLKANITGSGTLSVVTLPGLALSKESNGCITLTAPTKPVDGSTYTLSYSAYATSAQHGTSLCNLVFEIQPGKTEYKAYAMKDKDTAKVTEESTTANGWKPITTYGYVYKIINDVIVIDFSGSIYDEFKKATLNVDKPAIAVTASKGNELLGKATLAQ